MTDYQAACAALREARIAIEAGNIALAELAVREARMAIKARTFLHPGMPRKVLAQASIGNSRTR